MSTNQLKLASLSLYFTPSRHAIGHIHAYFEELIWILNLCLWNRRALFGTLSMGGRAESKACAVRMRGPTSAPVEFPN